MEDPAVDTMIKKKRGPTVKHRGTKATSSVIESCTPSARFNKEGEGQHRNKEEKDKGVAGARNPV